MNSTNHTTNLADEDDELILAEEDDDDDDDDDEDNQQSFINPNSTSWKVMIVDDESEIHAVTQLALEDFICQEKAISLISAYSSDEAKSLLKAHPDFALIFLDVVMEENDSGLQLVKHIRETLQNQLVRIILRTAHPGEAPEESVIVNYDINDYVLKIEMTQRRLFTMTVAGLRNYRDLMTLELKKAALKKMNIQLQAEIAERQLRDETLRLTQFSVENAADAIFWVKPNARIIYANEATCRSLGYSRDELYRMTLHDFDLNFPAEAWADHWKTLKQCGSLTFESLHKTKDQNLIPVKLTVNYRVFNGTEYHFVFVRDLTDRKLVEKEHARYKVLGELNSILSELNAAYERFVPSEFLNLLGKPNVINVQLGNQVEKEMTILFADIRGFTSLSEKLTPQENFNFINSYLSKMEPVIHEHHGFVDKYIGDAIMALFPNADDAVRASIAMLKTLFKYNQGRQRAGYQQIAIGIGLNTGPLMLGTVGGEHRMDGTVISDAVNLGSRIENMTKKYGVALLISQYTYSSLNDTSQYSIRTVDRVRAKGKSEFVTVYEVFDGDAPFHQDENR